MPARRIRSLIDTSERREEPLLLSRKWRRIKDYITRLSALEPENSWIVVQDAQSKLQPSNFITVMSKLTHADNVLRLHMHEIVVHVPISCAESYKKRPVTEQRAMIQSSPARGAPAAPSPEKLGAI